MANNNISLVLYTSTKGHWGKSTYRETVESLLSEVSVLEFGQLLTHIKVSPGQESIADEMEVWLRGKGFTVIKTVGEWSHGESMHKSYLQDLIKMSQLVTCDYVLNVEDDFKLFSVKYNIGDLFLMATGFLRNNHELLEIRFPRFNNEIERLHNIKAKHGIDANVIETGDTSSLCFRHADNANFHPCVRRARDIYICMKFIQDNLDRLSYNCEMGFSSIFKMLSREKSCLACFYPEVAQCLHIGVRTPEERDVAGQTFDR